YRRLRALQDYLRDNYTYSANPDPAPDGADPVVWFLTQSREGTALHFNTALALMARSIGIPARIVAGWVAGAKDETIYADMAHVWVEAYFGALGWVEFDATPGGAPARAGAPRDRAQFAPLPSPTPTAEDPASTGSNEEIGLNSLLGGLMEYLGDTLGELSGSLEGLAKAVGELGSYSPQSGDLGERVNDLQFDLEELAKQFLDVQQSLGDTPQDSEDLARVAQSLRQLGDGLSLLGADLDSLGGILAQLEDAQAGGDVDREQLASDLQGLARELQRLGGALSENSGLLGQDGATLEGLGSELEGIGEELARIGEQLQGEDGQDTESLSEALSGLGEQLGGLGTALGLLSGLEAPAGSGAPGSSGGLGSSGGAGISLENGLSLGAGGGVSGVAMGVKGPVELSDTPVFTLEGAQGVRYLRMAVAETYANGEWQVFSGDTSRLVLPGQSLLPDSVAVAPSIAPATFGTPATLTLTPLVSFGRRQPITLYTQSVSHPGGMEFLPYALLLDVNGSTSAGYSWQAVTPQASPQALRASRAVVVSGSLVALPPDIPQSIKDLASQLTITRATDYDKLDAIRTYLLQNYTYDLDNPSAPPGRDPIEFFLFDDRRGICSTFSSAFVLLARAAGIPARVVSGWAVSPTPGLQTVHAYQAHQWAEVPFGGLGWVTFDPTPASSSPVGRSETGLPSEGTPTPTATPSVTPSVSPTPSPTPTPTPTPSPTPP
ncbi:MAG: hypothetical protein FJ317_08420, partial [SAR202 cluster bacterium]|nr:hypothetical protein [SAR202 cluster bacterium]